MATLPGRCMNTLFCAEASSGEILRVDARGPFVCPQCGKRLVSPSTPLHKRAAGRRGSASRFGGLMAGTSGLAIGVIIGSLMFRNESLSAVPIKPQPVVASVQPPAPPPAVAPAEPAEAADPPPPPHKSASKHSRHKAAAPIELNLP
jgi:hypothetical protein